tara:strand:+ start:124 stop:534 length:411 start_codon:yes stop_codon:yes gene_type:complete
MKAPKRALRLPASMEMHDSEPTDAQLDNIDKFLNDNGVAVSLDGAHSIKYFRNAPAYFINVRNTSSLHEALQLLKKKVLKSHKPYSSYGLKHSLEDNMSTYYLTNGECIMACLLMGASVDFGPSLSIFLNPRIHFK